MSVQLFNGPLTNTNKFSKWLELVNGELSLTWQLTTSGGPTLLTWFLQYTDDPTGASPVISQEVDEQDTGKGVVSMAKVTRTFNENNATTGLSDGSHVLSTQFTRQPQYARVAMLASAGAAVVKLTASSGNLVP